MPRIYIVKTPEERFWNSILKGDTDECWPWVGRNENATPFRGSICVDGRRKTQKIVLAHRFSYEMHNGKIPDGLIVCHKCDYPPCCNPKHLFIGTHKDNTRDMMEKGRDAFSDGRIPHPMGEKSILATLTDSTRNQIKELRLSGRTTTSLAKEFGISAGHVSKIALGRLRSTE